MKKFLGSLSLIFFLAVNPVWAVEGTVDLGMSPQDVSLSKESNNLIAGERIRVSTTVFNRGNTDATGTVLFLIGGRMVGQAGISLRPGGVYDKFFIDIVVPQNDFNIAIRVANVQPEDTNLANNEILSPMFHVQQDNDNDGIGDDIDTDDDNDGLPDDYEIQTGTDPKKWDTDGDGVNDKDDAFPLDPKKRKKDEPVVSKPQAQLPKETLKPTPVAETAIAGTNNQTPTNKNQDKNSNTSPIVAGETIPATNKNIELVEAFYSSPEVALLKEVKIKARQVNWNTYAFGFSTNIKDLDTDKLEYSWSFDGTSETTGVYHTFRGLGKHNVNLKVRGPWDNYLYDNTDVYVTFWSPYNYWLWLFALLLLGALFYFGSHFSHHATVPKINRELKKPKESKEE
jgi:hypothetical protein